MGYKINNNIDKGYFEIGKNKSSDFSINNILEKYNIDLNDYYIIKGTNNFRLINVDDIPNYAGVVCFHKDMYSLEYINRWIDFLYKEINIHPQFLHKPPPEYMLNKIKVIQ
jgi:hypothetical protein